MSNMRITRQLLERTINNVNEDYLKEKKLMVICNSYNPDMDEGGRTLYKIMIAEVPSAVYLRSTDYETVDRAYFYLCGIMHFLHCEELKLKRVGDKR